MKKWMKLMTASLVASALLVGCAPKAVEKAPTNVETGAKEEDKKEEKKEEVAKFVPKREIEFIVPSSAGGGSDLNARIISEIAFKNDFSPKNFMVNNLPGGSGGVAFADVYGKKGADETLMVLHNGQIMSTIVNQAPVTADMLTYLQVVAFDNLMLAVRNDSPYKDIESVLEAAKTPDAVKIGGSQRGNTDHLAFELLNKYAEVAASYVQFNSSGDAMTALLGGHVDVAVFNPSECIGQVQAGEVVPLVTFSKERIGGDFAEVPTFVEKGYSDIELREVRALSGPPEMSEEAIAFYDEMIKQVTETDQWKNDYIEKNNLEAVFMTAAEAKEFFEKEVELYKAIFKEVGVIQ